MRGRLDQSAECRLPAADALDSRSETRAPTSPETRGDFWSVSGASGDGLGRHRLALPHGPRISRVPECPASSQFLHRRTSNVVRRCVVFTYFTLQTLHPSCRIVGLWRDRFRVRIAQERIEGWYQSPSSRPTADRPRRVRKHATRNGRSPVLASLNRRTSARRWTPQGRAATSRRIRAACAACAGTPPRTRSGRCQMKRDVGCRDRTRPAPAGGARSSSTPMRALFLDEVSTCRASSDNAAQLIPQNRRSRRRPRR
jgi:hypothetical protein